MSGLSDQQMQSQVSVITRRLALPPATHTLLLLFCTCCAQFAVQIIVRSGMSETPLRKIRWKMMAGIEEYQQLLHPLQLCEGHFSSRWVV